MKTREITKEIKGVFILPKKQYYFGKIRYGTPYSYPIKFCSTIFEIIKKNKNKKLYKGDYSFVLFGYVITIGSPIWFSTVTLGWKDKFNSPRHEWNPAFHIFFFKWQFSIFWRSPDLCEDEKYWEMILCYLHYYDKDIVKTEENWGWIDFDTKETTWEYDYVDVRIVRRKLLVEKVVKK